MAKVFVEWLDAELSARGWSRAELARRAGVTEASLSLIYSGDREPGTKICKGIAKALKLPDDVVYRVAGLLDVKPNEDQTVSEITHIYHELDEENQQDLLDYARLRLQKQERGTEKNAKRHRVP